MKEIRRTTCEEQDPTFPCIRCGKELHLYFNGGELDRVQCCGLSYFTEHTGLDLVVME